MKLVGSFYASQLIKKTIDKLFENEIFLQFWYILKSLACKTFIIICFHTLMQLFFKRIRSSKPFSTLSIQLQLTLSSIKLFKSEMKSRNLLVCLMKIPYQNKNFSTFKPFVISILESLFKEIFQTTILAFDKLLYFLFFFKVH